MTKILKRGLTGFDLKLLAAGLMILDHLHYFFSFTGKVPLLFSQLGRCSAWLFLFCTVEGFAHTSNRKRYFLRCYFVAVGMGLINYLIQLCGWVRADGFFPQNNIFAAFILCFLMWQGLDELKKKHWLKGIGLLALPWAGLILFSWLPLSIMPYAYFLECTLFPLPMLNEGGLPLLIGAVLLYALRQRRALQLTVFTGVELAWNLYALSTMGWLNFQGLFLLGYEWMGLFSVIFMACYNGKRGVRRQSFFYWFYPLHVYLFYILSCWMI